MLEDKELVNSSSDVVEDKTWYMLLHDMDRKLIFKGKKMGNSYEDLNFNDLDFENGDLRWKTFSGSSFVNTRLLGAQITRSTLLNCNFVGAKAVETNFEESKLINCWFYNANLRKANLRNANLAFSNFFRADLTGADLRGANLGGCNFTSAVMKGVDLTGAILPSFQIVPQEGSFIGWKKIKRVVFNTWGLLNNIDMIAKLEIPEDAERTSSLIGRKCRASKVKTLALFDSIGNPIEDLTGVSYQSSRTYYRVGEVTEADSYDDDIRVECTHGIHFVMTKKEAIEFQF